MKFLYYFVVKSTSMQCCVASVFDSTYSVMLAVLLTALTVSCWQCCVDSVVELLDLSGAPLRDRCT